MEPLHNISEGNVTCWWPWRWWLAPSRSRGVLWWRGSFWLSAPTGGTSPQTPHTPADWHSHCTLCVKKRRSVYFFFLLCYIINNTKLCVESAIFLCYYLCLIFGIMTANSSSAGETIFSLQSSFSQRGNIKIINKHVLSHLEDKICRPGSLCFQVGVRQRVMYLCT